MQSFRASQECLKNLIKSNTIEHDKVLLLTLTYRERQGRTSQMNDDFKRFIERVRAKYMDDFGRAEYVNLYEPNADMHGYHIHAILFFNDSPKSVFMCNHDLDKLWGHGFTSVARPFGHEDVYFYLTPHPARIETDENRHMHEKAIRLMSMPSNQPMYRASKGLRRPEIYTDNFEIVKKHLDENKYDRRGQQIYLNPMRTIKGNKLYYVKEYYKKRQE